MAFFNAAAARTRYCIPSTCNGMTVVRLDGTFYPARSMCNTRHLLVVGLERCGLGFRCLQLLRRSVKLLRCLAPTTCHCSRRSFLERGWEPLWQRLHPCCSSIRSWRITALSWSRGITVVGVGDDRGMQQERLCGCKRRLCVTA